MKKQVIITLVSIAIAVIVGLIYSALPYFPIAFIGGGIDGYIIMCLDNSLSKS